MDMHINSYSRNVTLSFTYKFGGYTNTLLYDGELAEAERQARELIAAGVDALSSERRVLI